MREEVQHNIINKKCVKLKQVVKIVNIAKLMGFEILSNWVIGFPGETWSQIRDTFRFAERLDIDYNTFHIATPYPHTELYNLCVKENALIHSKSKGYTKGMIQTEHFNPKQIQLLRAYEWDRLNFKNESDCIKLARMNGLTLEELSVWRKNTLLKCLNE